MSTFSDIFAIKMFTFLFSLLKASKRLLRITFKWKAKWPFFILLFSSSLLLSRGSCQVTAWKKKEKEKERDKQMVTQGPLLPLPTYQYIYTFVYVHLPLASVPDCEPWTYALLYLICFWHFWHGLPFRITHYAKIAIHTNLHYSTLLTRPLHFFPPALLCSL